VKDKKKYKLLVNKQLVFFRLIVSNLFFPDSRFYKAFHEYRILPGTLLLFMAFVKHTFFKFSMAKKQIYPNDYSG